MPGSRNHRAVALQEFVSGSYSPGSRAGLTGPYVQDKFGNVQFADTPLSGTVPIKKPNPPKPVWGGGGLGDWVNFNVQLANWQKLYG